MKILKSEADYEAALARVESLIGLDPAEGTTEAEELELLSLLVEKYEDEHYPVASPDPVEAIKFRMEQQGLTYADMVPFFGSKSKVSEVLNRKRGLSLAMIRALHQELGIPAEVLIADPKKELSDEITGIEWGRFPLAEMKKYGWLDFEGPLQEVKERSEEFVRDFFNQAESGLQQNPVLCRRSLRSDREMAPYALAAWHAKVLIDQKKLPAEISYTKNILDDDFFSELRSLSFLEKGPLLAAEFLLKLGIKVVTVPHLKGTHLDGAVFYNADRQPVIGLTLRYDRVDNFWFTLFHELAHLALHLENLEESFFDDLKSTKNISAAESEADRFAEEQLIPAQEWTAFYSDFVTVDDIINFAREMRISPAIVAGRIQKERDNFTVFRKLLGQGKVRSLFVS
jgi:HTH-type transcriptional regulator/antitoxin HigA